MPESVALDRLAQSDQPVLRRIGTADVWAALREGWADFQANPTQLVFLAIIYPIIGLVAARAASGGDVLHLIWPLISGFALVGPVAALGVYEMSRRREQGLPVSWTNAFDVLRSPALGSIVALGVLLLVIFALWILAARMIYAGTLGALPPTSMGVLSDQVLHTDAGRSLILLGNGVGFLFAVAVLALTVVSFPMLLDRNPGVGVAVRTSLRAVTANPAPIALWGLLVAGLLALGSLPAFVGLAVVLPVLGHATWHLYRKLVPAGTP